MELSILWERVHRHQRAIFVFGTMALITVAHILIPTSFFLWHAILERLYYLPIIFGACSFGRFGGLLSAVCAGVCYAPVLVITWRDSPQEMAGGYVEILAFLAVGAVTGILSQRERRRTAQLQQTAGDLEAAHKDLQASFTQLKRAGRLAAVGELAASLAHEIRNPLASIEGAIDIAQRTPSEERRREFLAVIKQESGRLGRLLTNLLDFARPRAPRISQVRIEQIVSSVRVLTTHKAQQLGVEVESELPGNLPQLECDAEQIEQALLNLALNALEATPKGGRVMISAQQQGDAVLIHVKDEGAGLSDAEVEKIFDPFYTSKEGGTGLGLPISYGILTQHEGDITVERNPDKGMTFTLVLPIHRRGT